MSPFSKPSGLWFILTLQSMGSLAYFHFFKHLTFEVQFFQGFIFTPHHRHMLACRAMQLRFFYKVETLLNNAFIKLGATELFSERAKRL